MHLIRQDQEVNQPKSRRVLQTGPVRRRARKRAILWFTGIYHSPRYTFGLKFPAQGIIF